MKSNNIQNRWINAGIAIGNNKEAKVFCPKCQKVHLHVMDVINKAISSKIIARLMICPECGAFNELRCNQDIDS